MGNSVSCIFCPHDSAKRDVLVIKEDGERIRFKQGTLVTDVLAAYPYHKVIRCCSDRSVLPDSFQLCCKWAYFLLPEGLSVNDTTYRSLIRAAAASKGDGFDQMVVSQPDVVNGRVECEVLSIDESGYRRTPWRPDLQTIKEVVSPPLHARDNRTGVIGTVSGAQHEVVTTLSC